MPQSQQEEPGLFIRVLSPRSFLFFPIDGPRQLEKHGVYEWKPVLKGNPIEDFPVVQHISMAVKQGRVLPLDSPTTPNASPSK